MLLENPVYPLIVFVKKVFSSLLQSNPRMSDLSDFKINDIAIPPSHGHKILKDYELHRHQIHAIFKLGGFSLKETG